MEITGRLTQDARVNTLKDGRRVVNFSLAINDRFKSRSTGEWKQVSTYVNCSYWMSDQVAPYLVKGTLVEVQGRISVSAWMNSKGEPKGSLDLHVNQLKFHGKNSPVKSTVHEAETITEPVEDLPF